MIYPTLLFFASILSSLMQCEPYWWSPTVSAESSVSVNRFFGRLVSNSLRWASLVRYWSLMFAGLRRQTCLVPTKTSVLVDYTLMDEMWRQFYDRVNSTIDQSSGLFDRLNVSFMLSINAYDDLEATLIQSLTFGRPQASAVISCTGIWP